MKTKELIDEISSLPVEDRVRVADSVLRTLNAPEAEIDVHWAKAANERLDEIRSGKVKTIPGEEVFESISNQLSK